MRLAYCKGIVRSELNCKLFYLHSASQREEEEKELRCTLTAATRFTVTGDKRRRRLIN